MVGGYLLWGLVYLLNTPALAEPRDHELPVSLAPLPPGPSLGERPIADGLQLLDRGIRINCSRPDGYDTADITRDGLSLRLLRQGCQAARLASEEPGAGPLSFCGFQTDYRGSHQAHFLFSTDGSTAPADPWRRSPADRNAYLSCALSSTPGESDVIFFFKPVILALACKCAIQDASAPRPAMEIKLS